MLIATALSLPGKVFTLQSIKSRIETERVHYKVFLEQRFLLYSPLNQGLKPRILSDTESC